MREYRGGGGGRLCWQCTEVALLVLVVVGTMLIMI